MKFAKILIVKAKSNEIINNIFVNLCFENEGMHSVIALVCKKWSRHINRVCSGVTFYWLDREFKANEYPMKIRGNTNFCFPLYDVLVVANGIK